MKVQLQLPAKISGKFLAHLLHEDSIFSEDLETGWLVVAPEPHWPRNHNQRCRLDGDTLTIEGERAPIVRDAILRALITALVPDVWAESDALYGKPGFDKARAQAWRIGKDAVAKLPAKVQSSCPVMPWYEDLQSFTAQDAPYSVADKVRAIVHRLASAPEELTPDEIDRLITFGAPDVRGAFWEWAKLTPKNIHASYLPGDPVFQIPAALRSAISARMQAINAACGGWAAFDRLRGLGYSWRGDHYTGGRPPCILEFTGDGWKSVYVARYVSASESTHITVLRTDDPSERVWPVFAAKLAANLAEALKCEGGTEGLYRDWLERRML